MILHNISKNYNNIPVLNNINIEIPNNLITAIIGKSGLGKTTLINIISGLINADSGSIEDIPVPISMVFQENRLLPWLTPLENIALVSDMDIARIYIHKVGLTDFSDSGISELSGGMQSRISIARALASSYDLLILDEPFTGLDTESKDNMITLIKKELNHRTCIFITHDLNEVSSLADHIINLEDLT